MALAPYARLYRFGKPHVGLRRDPRGLIGVARRCRPREITYAHAIEDGGGKTFDGKVGGWLGITDKYWASALVPDQKTPFNASFRGHNPGAGQQEFYWVDYQSPSIIAAPGRDAEGRSPSLFWR